MKDLELLGNLDLIKSGAEENYCKKCGSMARLRPTYHASCHGSYSEHLHYTCGWCGYDWFGNTLDAEIK